MKVAIIGSGPLACEMAARLVSLEASVTVFGRSAFGGMPLRYSKRDIKLSMECPWARLTSGAGRALSALPMANDLAIPTLDEYCEHYLDPLIQQLEGQVVFRKGEVLRVQKRFLGESEVVPKRSRLADLFRVVYRYCPDAIDEEIALSKEEVAHLEREVELFEDFDFVVESTGLSSRRRRMGPGGEFALNESYLQGSENFYQGDKGPFSWGAKMSSKSFAIIGDSVVAALALLELSSCVNETTGEIILVTEKQNIFEYLSFRYPELGAKIDKLISDEKKRWKAACIEVEKKIEQYRNLPRHEQIKETAPEFPEPRLKILTGYNITSLDQLSDREGIFMTIETPSWRRTDSALIKTFKVDTLINCNGYTRNNYLGTGTSLVLGESSSEPGYYSLGVDPDGDQEERPLEIGLAQIDSIVDDMLTYFTRVSS